MPTFSPPKTHHRRMRATVAIVALAAVASAAVVPRTSAAAAADSAVVEWIDQNAAALSSTDPDAPVSELEPLRDVVGDATVVGLGESTHGSHEQFEVKHRMIRFLVEELGFRTVGFEADFASGAVIDRYVVSGEGDPQEVVNELSSPFWATEEILDLVEWMRAYNESNADDPVRFFGTDLLQLRQLSFDEVTAYVNEVAPDQAGELAGYLDPVRLRGESYEQFEWYFGVSEREQAELISSAQAARDLVAGLPATADPMVRAYAEQHTRAIVGWYENFAAGDDFRAGREVFIADSIEWWQQLTGQSVAYWAANVHTSAAGTSSYEAPEEGQSGTFAGGHLEQRLGDGYVSIGTWFGEGAISSDYTAPAAQAIGAPATGLLEATLTEASSPLYVVPVPAEAPPAVAQWFDSPATMRMILPSFVEGEDGSDYTMNVPSLREAFDALVFTSETSASRLLGG